MTRDEFIDQLALDIKAALPSNVDITGTNVAPAFNAVLGTMYTTQPTKIPTIKHITDIEFN